MFSEFKLFQFLKTFLFLDYNKNLHLIFLDIFVVSIIIYSAYMILRRSKGILIGIGVFWLLGFSARTLQLELLEWVIQVVSPSIIFVIVIVLQPELRRIFSEFSRIRFFKFFRLKLNYEIDEVVEAATMMSRSKTGALIVFEKDVSLKHIVEQSVQLDAIISKSLILTVFKKNSALHDGAMIIQQNRIASASSYLPMSNSLGSSTLGARHRSALGIAEETDSVVLVTSEETGEISVCHDGEMIHPVKPFELKSLLLQLLHGETLKQEKNSTGKEQEGEG
ncbi:MAG: TIGR00159 family protein [Leptospiraceae bacterium]|nr:diadenylate cyclase CdaA [Leptospiraceae bacterium]MCP5503369.1 TIGR00159 family protein [Leptospiraceae bacterium]